MTALARRLGECLGDEGTLGETGADRHNCHLADMSKHKALVCPAPQLL